MPSANNKKKKKNRQPKPNNEQKAQPDDITIQQQQQQQADDEETSQHPTTSPAHTQPSPPAAQQPLNYKHSAYERMTIHPIPSTLPAHLVPPTDPRSVKINALSATRLPLLHSHFHH